MKKVYGKILAVLFSVAIFVGGIDYKTVSAAQVQNEEQGSWLDEWNDLLGTLLGELSGETEDDEQEEEINIYKDQSLEADGYSDNSVTFSWISDGEGAGYAIYRKCKYDDDYIFIGAIEDDIAGRMSFTDEEFVKGIKFAYKAVHYRFNSETGEEELLGEITNSFRVDMDATKIKSAKRNGTKVTLKWKKISGVAGYEIYRKNKGESYKKVKTITKGSTVTWTAKNVSKKDSTMFKIRSYVKYGKQKVYSAYCTPKEVWSVTVQKIKNKIKKLQKKYPDGKYWNHVGKSKYDYTTITNKPCKHKTYDDLSTCNHYACPDNITGYQCYGFAWLMSDLIFGQDAKIKNHYSFKKAKIGDVIRHDGHSVIITEKYDDYIVVGECNYGNTCIIKWGRVISKNALSGAKYSTRY